MDINEINFEDVKKNISEQKRRINLINTMAIDFECIKSMGPALMYNKNLDQKEKFVELSKVLLEACDNIESGILEIKKYCVK